MNRGRLGYLLALLVATVPAAVAWPQKSDPSAAAEQDDAVLGSASSLLIDQGEGEAVLIEAGTKLRREPHFHSPDVTVVDVELELHPMQREGDWVRVRFGERIGWAFLGDPPPPALDEEHDGRAPGLPLAPSEPLGPAFGELEPDPERLRRALDLIAAPEPLTAGGVFEVYTDVKGRWSRQLWLNLARQLTEAYRLRFGLSRQRDARFAVVIFARDKTYREFESGDSALAALGAAGHAVSGVAAVSAGQRTPTEVALLLVHELTHLLNRQTFASPPPPWLEEGLANDLAYSRLDRDGRLHLGTLGGRSFLTEDAGGGTRLGPGAFRGTYHVQGPIAALRLLKRTILLDKLIPLETLFDLTWREFVEPEGRELRYVESAFLVRYFLDGLEPDAFRGFLSAFQSGRLAGTDELLTALGVDLDELTAGFSQWLLDHSG